MTRRLMKNALLLAGTATFALHMAACTPTVATRGNLLSETKIAQIEPVTSLRPDVERIWGPPSAVAPFDDKIWYYIGETSSQKGIFEAEVEQRQVVRVTFDDMNAVTEVAMLDSTQAQDVDYVSRRTPTAGREFTAFQQFVGNLGKFNQNVKTKGSIPGVP